MSTNDNKNPANAQGEPEMKRRRRALRAINQNLEVVAERPNTTQKIREEDEDVKMRDVPVPMSLDEPRSVANQATQTEEVEMEEEPIWDIDVRDVKNPRFVTEYVDDLHTYYRKMEVCNRVSPDYMSQQFDINAKMRAILIDWIVEVHCESELREETLFLTVNLVDRFLERYSVARKNLQLVGLIAMVLAYKYEVAKPTLLLDDFINFSDKTYTRQELLHMERIMLNALQFNVSLPTSYVFLGRFHKAAQSEKKVKELSSYLIELCLVEYESLKFLPSLLAAAAVYTAHFTLFYHQQHWNKNCQFYTKYSESQLLECSRLMVRCHQKAGGGKLSGVHQKYSTSKYGYAANTRAHSS